jgi:hypothetical protein
MDTGKYTPAHCSVYRNRLCACLRPLRALHALLVMPAWRKLAGDTCAKSAHSHTISCSSWRRSHRQDEEDPFWHQTAPRPWDPPLSAKGKTQVRGQAQHSSAAMSAPELRQRPVADSFLAAAQLGARVPSLRQHNPCVLHFCQQQLTPLPPARVCLLAPSPTGSRGSRQAGRADCRLRHQLPLQALPADLSRHCQEPARPAPGPLAGGLAAGRGGCWVCVGVPTHQPCSLARTTLQCIPHPACERLPQLCLFAISGCCQTHAHGMC